MTCIVGLVHEGKVWMGGDAASASGGTWDITIRRDPKVSRVGPMLIGTAGSVRWGTVARERFKPPSEQEGEDPARYIGCVAEALKALAEEYRCLSKHEPATVEGIALIGYQGRLWQIDGEFAVLEPLDPYSAIGCGDQVAHGALFALAEVPSALLPAFRVKLALQAAERFSGGVRGPFTILGLG